MNIFKSKVLLVVLLSCNMAAAMHVAFDKPNSLELFKQAIDTINCSEQKKTALFNTIIYTALAINGAITNYVNTNYLIREEYLVLKDFPAAQAWYDEMAVKYPQAKLSEKSFLQTMRNTRAKYMQWCSTSNQIYCPQEALEEIETLYQKKLDGQELTQEETLALGTQEFVLLHEAGHIEHNDLFYRTLYSIGTFASLEAARAAFHENEKTQQNWTTFLIELIAFGHLSNIPSRCQERAADKFSYELVDMNALQGGINFFESEEVDSLWNIENKTLSPFVKTDSWIGTSIQKWVQNEDQKELDDKKFIKSFSLLRWFYDYEHGGAHPGPSVRAQSIRDEIQRRLDSQAQQPAA